MEGDILNFFAYKTLLLLAPTAIGLELLLTKWMSHVTLSESNLVIVEVF